jgi:TM2 domain-containing membrane protein YozV
MKNFYLKTIGAGTLSFLLITGSIILAYSFTELIKVFTMRETKITSVIFLVILNLVLRFTDLNYRQKFWLGLFFTQSCLILITSVFSTYLIKP